MAPIIIRFYVLHKYANLKKEIQKLSKNCNELNFFKIKLFQNDKMNLSKKYSQIIFIFTA